MALAAMVLVSLTSAAVSQPTARAALLCDSEGQGWPDFDEDCDGELGVGAPGWDVGSAVDAGAVFHVDGTERDSVTRLITARHLGFGVQPGARFGSSMVLSEVDGEAPIDLVIGAPGESVNGALQAGAVYVVYGSTSGLGAGRASARLTAASLGLSTTSGRFGSALAVWPDPSSDHSRLAVGEPFAAVDGKAGAGRLVSIKTPSLTVDQVISQGHGWPGAVETGDRFAASLSTVWDGYPSRLFLFVGSPYEDVGSKADAGVVTIIEPDRSWMISQDSAGVPGAAEPGDHFGAAITPTWQPFGDETGLGALIAAPDEDIGSVKDAGAIVMPYLFSDSDTDEDSWHIYAHSITADSADFPGAVESGDRLGSTLSSTFIGIPYEDVGSQKDAGAICVIDAGRMTAAGRVPATCIDQDSPGVPGAGEAGDRFGQALTTAVPGGTDDPPTYLVVGVPGEDVGTSKDTGAVLVGDSDTGTGLADWAEPLGSIQMVPRQPGGLAGASLP